MSIGAPHSGRAENDARQPLRALFCRLFHRVALELQQLDQVSRMSTLSSTTTRRMPGSVVYSPPLSHLWREGLDGGPASTQGSRTSNWLPLSISASRGSRDRAPLQLHQGTHEREPEPHRHGSDRASRRLSEQLED